MALVGQNPHTFFFFFSFFFSSPEEVRLHTRIINLINIIRDRQIPAGILGRKRKARIKEFQNCLGHASKQVARAWTIQSR